MTYIKNNFGSQKFLVQTNTGTTVAGVYTVAIKPGDFLVKVPGSNYVTKMATLKPVVGTDYIVGIAENFSSETTTLDGVVQVRAIENKSVLLAADASITANLATQALYNTNLLGKRVQLAYSNVTGQYTVLGVDAATNGFIIEYKDVLTDTTMVAVKLRRSAEYDI